MSHNIPKPDDVNQCLFHLIQQTPHHYDATTEQYAKIRLADWGEVLQEWADSPNALPQVAKVMKTGTVAQEHGQKLVDWLKQAAGQGNLTAMLYLSYLSAKGMILPQSLPRAVMLAQKVSDAGDWRGTRFLAEMLAVAPMLAPDVFGQAVAEQAKNWRYPNVKEADIQAACKGFLASEIAVKQMVRQKMQLAIEQGSPNAAQRLRVWTIQGVIPPAEPAAKFCRIESWLSAQLTMAAPPAEDEEDITILPGDMPFWVGDVDETPAWQKPLLYGGIGLAVLILMAIILKSMLAH